MKPILSISLSLVFLLLSTVSLASPKDPIWMDNHSGKVTPKGFMQKYKRGQIPQAQQGITPPDNTTSRTPSGTHSTGTGTLLWENHYNREGTLWDSADGVAVKGDKVFVVGRTETAVGYIAFSVRTYDAKNGALIWENHYDREGNLFDAAWDIAVDGNKVFVVGITETTAIGPSFSIRAYNANDGVLLWENNYDRENNLRDDAAWWLWGVAAEGNRVFAAGWTQTTVGGYAFSIRTYNATNGTLLWENHYDREGNLEDWADAVAVRGNTIFVAGSTQTTTGGYAFCVRAYNTANGTVLWQDNYDREGALDDWAVAVAVNGNRVFAAGWTQTTVGGYAFSIRTYDATNGTLLWQNNYDSEGNLLDWASSVATDGKRVFVGGGTGGTAPAGVGMAFTVRAFDAINGTLLWEDRYTREENTYNDVLDIAVSGNKIFVAGMTGTISDNTAMSIRAYNAINGTLPWEDYCDGDRHQDDWAWRIATSGDKVFVVGSVEITGGIHSFSVRAYKQ